MVGSADQVNEGLSMGQLLAFRSCLDMFIRGFNTLAELYNQASKLRRTSVRYFDLLDNEPLIEPQANFANKPMRRLEPCEGHLR